MMENNQEFKSLPEHNQGQSCTSRKSSEFLQEEQHWDCSPLQRKDGT